MAICDECFQDMTTTTSCRDWRMRVDGRLYELVPYGSETRFEDDDEYATGEDDLGLLDGEADENDDRENDDRENDDWENDDSDLTVIWGRFPNTPKQRPLQVDRSSREESYFPDRCGDCRVAIGRPHHPGCDLMECPVCHRQAISCGCWDGSTVPPAAETFRAPRPTGEHRRRAF